jgi:glycosyltransferase involved in cell wall biosynthesis
VMSSTAGSDGKRRRVLLLIDSLGAGGAERQLTVLAKYLPEPWTCMVWSMGGGPFADVVRELPVDLRIEARRWRFDPLPAVGLLRLMRRFRPDVVHSWGWMSTLAAAPCCSVLGVPLVDGSIRSGRLPERRRFAGRMAMHSAARVVANSEAGLAAWRPGGEKGRVVHNGFDFTRPACGGASRDSGPQFTVAMVARLAKRKDFGSFFEAARRLSGQSEGWRFLAVGSGPRLGQLRSEAADLVSSGILLFVEPGLEVMHVLQEVDVGVLLTDSRFGAEGCSNAIMEYMACSLPVICTNEGGNPELVSADTGFLVPPFGVEAVCDHLSRLRQDPQAARAMGSAGRAKLEKSFSPHRMARRMVSIYEELIS